MPFGVCCHTRIIGIGCLYTVEHHDRKLTSHCKPDPATHNLACWHARFRHIIIKFPNELIVFAPFLLLLIIIITSPRQLSGDVLLFYVSFSLLVWLQNEVCETYYFCSVSYYYYYGSQTKFVRHITFHAGNRHKQNSWFCKEIREDNFRFWWRRVHEDASQGMYMSKIEIFFFTARILLIQRMLCCGECFHD